MALNERSLNNLQGVHPDLVRVVKRAAEISPMPFVVTEGLRNLGRQKALVKAGKSWTLDGRHLTGHAVDLVDADNFGYEMPDMTVIAKAMRQAAAELNVPIEWGANVKYGGDWKTQNDSPHFQLPVKSYPASGISTVQKAKETVSNVAKAPATQVGTGAGAGYTLPQVNVPKPPDISKFTEWKVFAGEAGALLTWAMGNMLLTVALIGFIIFLAVPSLWPKSWRPP
jgi:peptidoglycan L-alanyl-D-glutamate endopeptidase CwlK